MADADSTAPKRKRRPWWIWGVLVLLIVGALGWRFGREATQAVRGRLAGHYAAAAAEHVGKEEWSEALLDINLARRWAPEDPAVLRVLADFMIAVKGDVFSLHHILARLADAGLATPQDQLRIAEFQLTQGDVVRARETLEALPEAERQKRRAQELLANVLRVEGRTAESEKVMRRALMADGEDSGARLRLALLDYQTPFPEIRAQARERLWQIAAGKDDAALQAMQFLSGESALNLPQAEELMQLAKQHPKPAPATGYRILSALMRLRPSTRQEVLDAETAKFDAEAGNSAALLQWLLDEREYDRLLKLVPVEAATTQLLVEFHLKALSGSGRWNDVEKLLTETKDLPLPIEVASLWRARASHNLKRDPARTQQHLLAAFSAAGQGEKGEITLETARFAEECGLWRVAATCYEGIARIHPSAQIRMLEKVHEMALRERDSDAVLQSARYLAEQNPANRSFGDRQAYFQLIIGADMETAIARSRRDGAATSETEKLLQALAAYRLGDRATMNSLLAGIIDTDSLSTGERAVYAGLLAIGGKAAAAFQIAEKIPAGLLLAEEASFLKRAL